MNTVKKIMFRITVTTIASWIATKMANKLVDKYLEAKNNPKN